MLEKDRKYKARKRAEGTYNNGDRKGQKKRYFAKHPEVKKAGEAIRSRLRHKTLTKPTVCSLCHKLQQKLSDIHGHHSDYNKPTSVIWVCRSCHRNIHRNLMNNLPPALDSLVQ